MINTIKKLHELQLMAVNSERISVHVEYYNTGNGRPFWSFRAVYWLGVDIKNTINIDSSDQFAEHRIDMMLRYKTLEKQQCN